MFIVQGSNLSPRPHKGLFGWLSSCEGKIMFSTIDDGSTFSLAAIGLIEPWRFKGHLLNKSVRTTCLILHQPL